MCNRGRITKSLNGFKALGGISFEVEKGDVVGYLGLNGAGKTSTIKILANLLGMPVVGGTLSRVFTMEVKPIGDVPTLVYALASVVTVLLAITAALGVKAVLVR